MTSLLQPTFPQSTDLPQAPQTTATATATYAPLLQRLYVAYFGRPGDASGIASGSLQLENSRAPSSSTQALVNAYGTNATVKALVDGFSTSAESLALYAGTSVRNQVNAVYQNILNRSGDAGGLDYWSGEVSSGRLTLSNVALAIIAAAETTADNAIVSVKLAIATNFTAALSNPSDSAGYAGNAAAATARDLLRTVAATDTASSFDSRIASTISTLATSYSASVNAPSVAEGNAGNTNLTFTITLERPAFEAVTLTAQTLTTGTATSGQDFVASTQTVTVAAGQSTAQFSVQVVGDTTIEPNETINVSVNGARLRAAATGTGTIVNDDASSAALQPLAQAQSQVNASINPIATRSTLFVNTTDSGSQWTKGNLTYSFNTSIPAEYFTFRDNTLINGWEAQNAEEQAFTRLAFADINNKLGIQFTEVANNGDMRFNAVIGSGAEAGFAFLPSSGNGSAPLDGDVWLDVAQRRAGYYDVGGYGRLTITHEIGHGLGLKHTFQGDNRLPTEIDDTARSLLSYTGRRNTLPVFTTAADGAVSASFTSNANPSFFTALDIQTLQAFYGANTTANLGANTYTVNTTIGEYQTIWDAGGVDLIDASSATNTCIVDLRGGTFSSINLKSLDTLIAEYTAVLVRQGSEQAFAASYVTRTLSDPARTNLVYNGLNNLGIVLGTVIENVTTGSGNDTVTDNNVNNIIRTGAGDDTINLGNGGFDIVDGGTGIDTVNLAVAQSTVQRGTNADGSTLLVGANFAVQLIGIERIQFSDALVTLG